MICTLTFNLVYTLSYIIYNVSHTYAVHYNINSGNTLTADYTLLKELTSAYTAFCVIAWVFTNINTYKYAT